VRGVILIAFMVCFLVSAAEAKDSKEYTFMMTIINTLECLQSVVDEDAKEGDSLTEMMSKAMVRNNRLKDAKSTIDPYSKSKDRVINVVVKGFNLGMDLLTDGNNQLIKNVRKLSNAQKAEDLKDFQYEAAKILTQNREAWEAIGKSAALTWPVYIEYAKTENPTGAIPFKISDKERKALIKEIDHMFGDKLANSISIGQQSKADKKAIQRIRPGLCLGFMGSKRCLAGKPMRIKGEMISNSETWQRSNPAMQRIAYRSR
jgi:secreted Zn-dependent insulinase-like peptidase